MNIQTVANNLRMTIAGKETMLASLNSRRVIDKVAIKFLEINIDELKRILQDVEQCTYSQADIDNYEQRIVKDMESIREESR